MKCYVDLEGKVEAKLGDLVALLVTDSGIVFKQEVVSSRPIASEQGYPMFDIPLDQDGPFMSTDIKDKNEDH